jgi:hypothetical protein
VRRLVLPFQHVKINFGGRGSYVHKQKLCGSGCNCFCGGKEGEKRCSSIEKLHHRRPSECVSYTKPFLPCACGGGIEVEGKCCFVTETMQAMRKFIMCFVLEGLLSFPRPSVGQ